MIHTEHHYVLFAIAITAYNVHGMVPFLATCRHTSISQESFIASLPNVTDAYRRILLTHHNPAKSCSMDH